MRRTALLLIGLLSMSTIINHTYEGAESAATLGYYGITQSVDNASGNGLGGSTYGLRSGHATLINRFYGNAKIQTPGMSGRCFSVEADLDHADYLNTNDYNELFQLFSGAVGSNSGFLFVRHGDYDDGSNPIVERAIWVLAAASGSGAVEQYASAANVFTAGVTMHVKVTGQMSSAPLVGDGSFKLYLDGVLVANVTGLDLWGNTGGTGTVFSEMRVGPMGRFDNLVVTDDCEAAAVAAVPLINNSVPCCHEPSSGPGGTSGDVLGPPTTAPLTPWTIRCGGGGTYPAGTPVTHSEDWTE